MSNFLDNIIANVQNTKDRSLTEVARYEYANIAINAINSLGENARRMLEIGILQDELVKLGFTRVLSNCELEEGGSIDIDVFVSKKACHYYSEEDDENHMGKIYISFEADVCTINIGDFWIDCIRHEDDVLTKVKELINEK